MKSKLERAWKESIVAAIEILPYHYEAYQSGYLVSGPTVEPGTSGIGNKIFTH
jgi:hypothetical protein